MFGLFRKTMPRAFDGGKWGRRLRALPTSGESVNSQIARYGKTLVTRSRYLCQNNPYAAAARASYVANMIGAGIKPASLVEDRAKREVINKAWLRWTDEADADGLTDFYGLQAQAAGQMFEAGECFVRIRRRREQDGLSVPMQLQVLPAEMLPSDNAQDLGDGRVILQGVEFDAIGRRVAYHFLRRHPGDSADPRMNSGEVVRVPADEVLHLFAPDYPGQVRGIPHLAPVITKLALLDQYDDAELDRKKTAALYAGFVTSPAPEEAGLLGDEETADDGVAMVGLQPGTMQTLLPGEDIKFSDPADVGGSYEAFQYRNLLAIAAGMGIPYSAMTGDLRQASYGSQRAGLLEYRRRLEQTQHAVMVFQFCRAVWRQWFDTAAMVGAIDGDVDRRDVKWITPRWDWVDPKKDREAEIMAINAGLKARSDVIEAEGYDPEEVDARIAADREREAGMGLSFKSELPDQPRAINPEDE